MAARSGLRDTYGSWRVATEYETPALARLAGSLAAASARGPRAVTPAQVLLRWALDRGMAVIPKSGDPGRIRENLGCVADGCGLTGEEAAGLDALGARYRKRCWDPSGVL